MQMDMYVLLGVVLIALATQLIVEAIKVVISAVCRFFKRDVKRTNMLFAPFLSLGWAIALCILSGSDLFYAFGYPLYLPYLGAVATGIIASLGANRIYDLVMDFNDYKGKIAVDTSKGLQT